MIYLLFLSLSGAIFSSAPYPKPMTIEGRVIKVGVMDSSLEGLKPNFPLHFMMVQSGRKRVSLFSKEHLPLSLYGHKKKFTVQRRGKKGVLWLVHSPLRVKEKKHGICKAP